MHVHLDRKRDDGKLGYGGKLVQRHDAQIGAGGYRVLEFGPQHDRSSRATTRDCRFTRC